jgi:hypothetical protein
VSKKRLLYALGLLALAAFAGVAPRLRGHGERCAMDGAEVAPAFRVQVIGGDGKALAFCGVECASHWLSREDPEDVRILVTDSRTGAELDAAAASYVLALSTLRDGAPDAIRVFARRGDAERSVEAYGGALLTGTERPFEAWTGQP